MPRYTYVTSYKGATYVAQGTHSNFKGFATWINDLPAKALPGLTPEIRKELNPYRGDYEPVPNCEHVWRKTYVIG